MKKFIEKTAGIYLNLTAPIFPKLNRKHAFKLLCKVNRIPVSQEGKEFLKTATLQYLKLSETEVALHKWGNGPKNILFLHGWMSYTQRWKPFINSFDLNEFTVYSLDAPAHGFSKGTELNIEMYREGVEEAIKITGEIDTLICHSLGSLVGAYAFLTDPKIPIKKYVFMGTPSGLNAILGYFKETINISNRTIDNLKIKVDSILKIPSEKLTLDQFLNRTEKPVLIVHEISDTVTPFQPIKEAIPNKKNIQTFFTQGQDHNLKGKETLNEILKFINQTKKETATLCM